MAKYVAPSASAILLDPVYSILQSIASGALPAHTGLLSALEEQGYLGDPTHRETPLIEGWGVEKAKRLGANGVKLLLFYHPKAGSATERQEELVQQIASECRRYEIPLFLEPISYPLDPSIKKGTAEFAVLRREIVIESTRRLSRLGPDVMKVEFPLDVKYDAEPTRWADACAELDGACIVPWALLSAGEPFDVFKEQLKVACRAHCSGFVAGRAIWQEAVHLSGRDRIDFLSGAARKRLAELTEIAVRHGQAWSARYSPVSADERSYPAY
ncbi:MAG: tagatose 1,6-diphosphate aldolase [Chloroflexi bacterium]|nr:tagatose 1,6-diphosphate aldolase [Chloroflexota bacterium]